jgi:hypothetical protein
MRDMLQRIDRREPKEDGGWWLRRANYLNRVLIKASHMGRGRDASNHGFLIIIISSNEN